MLEGSALEQCTHLSLKLPRCRFDSNALASLELRAESSSTDPSHRDPCQRTFIFFDSAVGLTDLQRSTWNRDKADGLEFVGDSNDYT